MRTLPRRALLALLVVAAGCGDDPIAPEPEEEDPLRTVLFHRQDTGENVLLNSDGRTVGSLAIPGDLNVPFAVSDNGQFAAVVHGAVLGLVTIAEPGVVDTIIAPLPSAISLASFSRDGRYVAVVGFESVRGVLLYDRANKSLDTIPYGDRDAVLPPVFSPDGRRIALVTESRLSLFAAVIDLDAPNQVVHERFGFSRFANIPVFGWPRWTDEGILMAFVREGGAAPDTLLSGLIDPFAPGDFLDEQFRVVLSPVSDDRPEVRFGPFSTYAYAPDGGAMVLGADPGTGGPERHALYLITPDVDRIQLLLDDPAQVPILPNFVN